MVEPLLPAEETRPDAPRPVLGYAMVLTAATLWGINGTVSKSILDTGVSSLRLSEVRSAGAFLGLLVALLVVSPRSLRFGPGRPTLTRYGT